MRDYFARLKPNGWVLFEERNINERPTWESAVSSRREGLRSSSAAGTPRTRR
jgi:hypothetical protein